jgi:hypothetical protein
MPATSYNTSLLQKFIPIESIQVRNPAVEPWFAISAVVKMEVDSCGYGFVQGIVQGIVQGMWARASNQFTLLDKFQYIMAKFKYFIYLMKPCRWKKVQLAFSWLMGIGKCKVRNTY